MSRSVFEHNPSHMSSTSSTGSTFMDQGSFDTQHRHHDPFSHSPPSLLRHQPTRQHSRDYIDTTTSLGSDIGSSSTNSSVHRDFQQTRQHHHSHHHDSNASQSLEHESDLHSSGYSHQRSQSYHGVSTDSHMPSQPPLQNTSSDPFSTYYTHHHQQSQQQQQQLHSAPPSHQPYHHSTSGEGTIASSHGYDDSPLARRSSKDDMPFNDRLQDANMTTATTMLPPLHREIRQRSAGSIGSESGAGGYISASSRHQQQQYQEFSSSYPQQQHLYQHQQHQHHSWQQQYQGHSQHHSHSPQHSPQSPPRLPLTSSQHEPRSPQTPPLTPSPRDYSGQQQHRSPHHLPQHHHPTHYLQHGSSIGGGNGSSHAGSSRGLYKVPTREAGGSISLSTAGGSGGGGDGSSSSSSTTPTSTVPTTTTTTTGPNRRLAHILSEQKRREKINGGFDELKSVIPDCAQNTDSKATILRKAVSYILLLEEELKQYSDDAEHQRPHHHYHSHQQHQHDMHDQQDSSFRSEHEHEHEIEP